MTTIKIIEGQACLIQPILVNNDLVPVCRELSISTETMISAVKKRMQKCMDALTKAVEKNLILSKTDTVIMYADELQSVRGFNIRSYQAMERVVEVFQDCYNHDVHFVPLQWIDDNFKVLEINQMKKAICDDFAHWSDTASALEELELHAIQKREC